MQLKVKSAGIFLGVSRTDYTRKSDGKPGCFYNVALKQGGEVGNVPCGEDLYKQYESGQLKDFTECDILAVFNDQYGRLQVTAVNPKK